MLSRFGDMAVCGASRRRQLEDRDITTFASFVIICFGLALELDLPVSLIFASLLCLLTHWDVGCPEGDGDGTRPHDAFHENDAR